MAVGGFDTVSAVLAAVLGLTSYLGLRSARALAVVVRHPSLALADTLLVFTAVLLVGSAAPLALVAVSSALLVGLLFPVRVSLLLCSLLVAGHLLSPANRGATAATYIEAAVMVLSLAVIGAACRSLAVRQQLAEASAAASVAAEERLRLARELHDTVGKTVQGLALAASALPRWIEQDPASAYSRAQSVADGARDAVAAARDMMSALRLDSVDRPFHEVLAGLLDRWPGTGPCRAELVPVAGLSPLTRHELLAAAAEALENVARHAPGAAIDVRLCPGPDGVVLTITDDGPGFDEARRALAPAAGHFGLVGMEERLRSVGGSAVVRSEPDLGTMVTLRVPVPVLLPARPTRPTQRAERRPAPLQEAS
jgi:signal transduction histidine kinase